MIDDDWDWVALKAEIAAKTVAEHGPEWEAKYGEASWLQALICFGMLSPGTTKLPPEFGGDV